MKILMLHGTTILKLCKLSAKDFYVNVIREAGLNSPFEDGCMEELVGKLEKKVKFDD